MVLVTVVSPKGLFHMALFLYEALQKLIMLYCKMLFETQQVLLLFFFFNKTQCVYVLSEAWRRGKMKQHPKTLLLFLLFLLRIIEKTMIKKFRDVVLFFSNIQCLDLNNLNILRCLFFSVEGRKGEHSSQLKESKQLLISVLHNTLLAFFLFKK